MMFKKSILTLMMTLALAACGVKPHNVKPPEGAADIYPSTYPYPDEEALEADKNQAIIRAEKAKAQAEAAKNDAQKERDLFSQ